MTTKLVAIFAAASLLFVAACDNETKQDSGTAADTGTIVDQEVKSDAATPDKGATPDQGTGGDATKCTKTAAELAKDVLASGKKILNGVKLTTSTDLAELKKNASTYVGKVVRIEGWIDEICQSQGCYIELKDAKGNVCNLKVTDGSLDFRKLVPKVGVYAVGEGVFAATGSHGAQVYIEKHGAMIGSKVCKP